MVHASLAPGTAAPRQSAAGWTHLPCDPRTDDHDHRRTRPPGPPPVDRDEVMAGSDFRPVYHPAGHDKELRSAAQDLRTGRWVSMARLLERTDNWGLWTQRTQVLAAVSAGSDVVQAWRAEQPNSVAALVMHTRVCVERAVRAHRAGHARTGELWQEAWSTCREAARINPADPVPWVCLLALALLDEQRQMAEHRIAPPAPMLPPAPGASSRRSTSATRTTARPTTACSSSCTRARPDRSPRPPTSSTGPPAPPRRDRPYTSCRSTYGSSATVANAARRRRSTCTGSPRTPSATPSTPWTPGSTTPICRTPPRSI